MGGAARQKLAIHAVVLIPAPSSPSGAKAPGKVSTCAMSIRPRRQARCQDGQGPRAKDRRLNVKQCRRDHVAKEHDGIDHGDKRIDLAQANVGQRRQDGEGDEQQADEHETEPDFLPVRRCIEQPQVIL